MVLGGVTPPRFFGLFERLDLRPSAAPVLARRYSSMSVAMKATKPIKARVSVTVCSMAVHRTQ